MIHGHGGNIYALAQTLGCRPSDITDMSSNVNPLGPPGGLARHLRDRLNDMAALPEVDAGGACRAFAAAWGLPPETVLAGNGTTQFIYALPRALGSRNVLILGPVYADYADACRMNGTPFSRHFATEADDFRPDPARLGAAIKDADTVFICNPNNPTGALTAASDMAALCREFPAARFIVDESYLSFAENGEAESLMGLAGASPNLIVLNSMSKIFRIPGLRIGFLISNKCITDACRTFALPWNVNALAQAAALWLMAHDAEVGVFVREARRFLGAEKNRMIGMLSENPALKVFPSATSYLLMRLPEHRASGDICDFLARRRILIRNCDNFEGLSERFIRISLKTEDENTRVADLVLEWLEHAK